MQRYRINYRWLIGVFATTLVVAIVAFFVQRWQVERKAGLFLAKGEAALAESKYGEAFDSYSKYVKLRPKEDDARIKMAKVAFEVIKGNEFSAEERGRAYGVLDQTVRTTNDSGLRRDLAEIVIGFRPQDAKDHLEILLAENPNDPKLNSMMITALFKVKEYKQAKSLAFKFIGYNQETKEFDTENAALEGESEVYTMLSEVLVQKDRNPELARRVIDQMVVANPESSLAHLRKSLFLSSIKEMGEATISLDKAYELDPKNATVLSRKGMAALFGWNNIKPEEEAEEESKEKKTEEEVAEEALAIKVQAEEAKGYFAIGLKEHPDNVLFYRLMAQAEQRLDQPEAALEVLDLGIRKLGKKQSVNLVISKIDLLFGLEDYPAIDREIKRLTQLNRPDLLPAIDFQRARIQFRKQYWIGAAQELKRVQPLLFDKPRIQVLAGTMLAVCYESQGIHDLAMATYKSVLNDYPNHEPALKGLARMKVRLKPSKTGIELDRIINNNLELPVAQQEWDRVNEIVEEVIISKGLGEARAKLLRAKVLMKRNRFDEAKGLIRQAAKDAPDDIDVHFAAILLVTSDPEKGSPVAMKLLDRLEGKWGVSLRSLAQRAELLCDIRPEDVSDQLRSLASKTGDFSEAEKRRFDNVLGLKFEQLGKPAEAREYFEKSAALEPNNLPIRMHLFDLALREQNDAAMQKSQATILDFVKSKDHPNYILTEVKRNIFLYGHQKIDKAEFAKSLGRLDLALSGDRKKWHELHIAYGQVLLLLGGDIDLALQHFDEALDSGPAKSNAVRMQVRLLADRGLFGQARERMKLLNKQYRGKLLGRLEAEILVKTGDPEAGFLAAEKLAKSQPNVAATQVWFSRIAQETGKLDLAATALRRSLETNSSNPDNWLRLIGIYAEQGDFASIESTIREAHLGSEAEFLPLLTGKYYELQARWQFAENIYLAAYADQPDSLPAAHRLADFYLHWTKKDDANLGKAAVYINRILRAANHGEAASDHTHVAWARNKAARILYAKQDYQQSLKAEALLRQSEANGRMNSEETGLLIDILISRNDPQSLMQAKNLLATLHQQNRLPKKGALQLARLYSQTHQWDESKSLLLDLLVQYSSDPAIQATYIELLIEQGEYTSAENRIKRLRDIAPNDPNLVELQVRLASERGNPSQLNRLLTSLLPKMKGAMAPAQLKTILSVAQLAERYGDYELAEKLYKVHAKRLPDQAFQLARFLAYHGDCEQALRLMKRFYPDNKDDVVQLANRMITVRRDEIGDKYDDLVDRLLNSSLRDDPDSVSRQLARAEAYETQGKHDESIAAYDQLLQRDDLSTRVRAAAMNNLGFQLGLLERRVDEAEQLIDEAMKTFGPVSDMLDTRAIVRIAQGKYDLAIEDMKLAISIGNDPIQHFHLAKALILAGDGQAAKKAWEKSQELGFKEESLPKLEKASFEKIRQQIENFEAQNAKL